jgi:hypothetical protein
VADDEVDDGAPQLPEPPELDPGDRHYGVVRRMVSPWLDRLKHNAGKDERA